jgi:hypothetical protein
MAQYRQHSSRRHHAAILILKRRFFRLAGAQQMRLSAVQPGTRIFAALPGFCFEGHEFICWFSQLEVDAL